MENPWKTLSIKPVYDNPWISVTHREVTNPSGKPGIYGLVHFKNLAIGVVPLDNEGNVWLVGQFRYPLGRYSWEIPEGGCPLGQDPLEAGKRELREETGIIAGHWEKLLDLHLSNSVTDETGVVYLARNLTFGKADPEDTEDLAIKRLPLSEAVDMVNRGEITDVITVAALLRVWMQYLAPKG